MNIIRRILNFFRSKQYVYVREVTRPYIINTKKSEYAPGVAFVAGGSGVIGRAICFRLAAMGCRVYVGGSTLESASKVSDEIQHAGLQAIPLAINLQKEDSIDGAFGQILEKEGRLDIFIDCAGGGARERMKSITEQSPEVIKEIINLNLVGGLLCAKSAATIMKRQNGGKIIFISSICGVAGLKNYSEYAAAKSGIVAAAKSLAMELGKFGISVNCVSPGIVQRGTIDDIQLKNIRKTNWLDDYCLPEDVAGAVAFLVGEDSRFITGQNIIVDGGRSLGLKGS